MEQELLDKVKFLEEEKKRANEINLLMNQKVKELEAERDLLQHRLDVIEERYDSKLENVRQESRENYELLKKELQRSLKDHDVANALEESSSHQVKTEKKTVRPGKFEDPRESSSETGEDEDGESESQSEQEVRKTKKIFKKLKQEKKQKFSLDSVFGDTYSSEGEETTSSQSSGMYRKKEIRFISEIPSVEPFDPVRGQSIHHFFTEYEKYCDNRFPHRKDLWVKELKNCLKGKLLDGYEGLTCDGTVDIKYEWIKSKIVDHALRMKKSVKKGTKKDFDSLRMKPGESLLFYAMRLETAGKRKFGEKEMQRNLTVLFKKFIETVPEEVRNYFHRRRNDAKRYGGHKYTWKDVLQDLEDQDFELENKETRHVNMAAPSLEFPTYRDALTSSLKNEESSQLLFQIKTVFDHIQREQNQGISFKRREESLDRETHASSRNQSYNMQNKKYNNQSSRKSTKACDYCKKTGHDIEKCKIRLGLCFTCNGKGHRAEDCATPPWCSICKKRGHTRSRCCDEERNQGAGTSGVQNTNRGTDSGN